MHDSNWTLKDIFNLNLQTWAACALMAAVKLDLFTALDRGPEQGLEIERLAADLKLNPRALGMLGSALTAQNFLERDGEILRLTEPSRRWLSADRPDYLGYLILHFSHILTNWTKLYEAVRSGRQPVGDKGETVPEDEWREAFLMAMFNAASHQADQVAASLDLSDRSRLLDLGGGPGTYAVHFCLRYPNLKATVFDQPGTEKFARATFERFGLRERVDFVGGDFLSSPLPGGFDAAWLSQVLHGESPAEAAMLVRRGAEALKPGGLLAVQEFIVDDDRRGPALSTLFSLNMLVQTEGGQSYTEAEIRAMMSAAGLGDIKRVPADLPPGCGILAGLKA